MFGFGRKENPQPQFDDSYIIGDVPGVALPELKKPPTLIETLTEDRPKIDAGKTLATFKADTGFYEKHRLWKIKRDLIGLRRHLPGGVETYSHKLFREEKKGQQEAASVGTAKIGENKIALYAMHWDFFAGSMGVVAGEKFQQASDIARKENIPFVSVYSSAGVRQYENFPGLLQMTRMVHAINRFKEKSKQPHIGILLGQVWGGISASAVPLADVKIAVAGTDYGFSGPRVIETYEGKPVPKGAQSAEAHILHRNIDVMTQNKTELLLYLDKFLNATSADRTKLTEENLPELKFLGNPTIRVFPTQKDGFLPLFAFEKIHSQQVEQQIFPDSETQTSTKEKLYDQYQELARDGKRVDTEFIVHTAFSDVVPLYNSYKIENRHFYPAIIAALGKIGDQPFLLVGNQPSYQKSSDGVRKIPANPTPEDFKYLRRMLKMGERLELPVVFFTDTLGAKPTLEAEKIGQSEEIAETILLTNSYKKPAISVVIGALGSGGGLAITPKADHLAMLDRAMAFVAEPSSSTSILYNEANPSKEKIMNTLEGMRATAQDQKDLGIIDEVIPESQNPYQTIKNIRDSIATAFLRIDGMSQRKRLSARNNRIRNLKGLEIKKN